ncbi:chromosomal replication initiator protein DnaA [Leadbetterella sp. DM7]|uniref:chromosomal replication initiator protein DnaA n=1 Tax=Leadbetterella sp. DM7 TaxID=3235085 RepID=UPI00349E9C12
METAVRNDVAQVWKDCLMVIRENVTEQSFKTWFEPIIPYKLINKRLIIQVPSQFFYEWLENNYVKILRKALDYAIGKDGQLEYTIIIDSGGQKAQQARQKPGAAPEEARNIPRNPFEIKVSKEVIFDSQLNKNYRFENFVEGSCNRLARAASVAVAQKPSVTAFNPLMIYGEVGLGKTHLVQAIGNYIEGQNGNNKLVLYVSSEKFTSQFINAIRDNSLQDFMNFYMMVDVLIIDDIQFLAGKEKTQETFFHIFNHLHQSGKQIVMTSDRPPRELSGMEDRLLSRFKWGLTTDIQTPDLETRMAIVQNKLATEKAEMDMEVVEYLANCVDSNVRELEGVVNSLIVDSALLQRKIDIELAKYRIKSLVEESQKAISIDKIIDVVTAHFNIKVSDIKGKTRLREVVLPRQIAMYLTKEFTELSLKTIGYHFGGRDHSTVIHAIQTINDLQNQDRELLLHIKDIKEKLKK